MIYVSMLILYIALFFVACIVLARSGTLVVKSLTRIAAHYRMSEFLVSFLLVGFATSCPELFVGISAALAGDSSLSLGNLVGANIINLTLAVGLAAVLGRGIDVKTKIGREDAIYTFIILLIPVLLLLDRELSRFDGLILILIFLFDLGHLFYSYQKRLPLFIIRTLNFVRGVSYQEIHRKEMRREKMKRHKGKIVKQFFVFILSLIFLILSAKILVMIGLKLTAAWQLETVIFGLLIVSLGTTLAELTFDIEAVINKKKEMVIGNLFGSLVVNFILILGVVALIKPIVLDFLAWRSFLLAAGMMFLVLGLFIAFIRSKSKLSFREGLILILGYIGFVLVEILIK